MAGLVNAMITGQNMSLKDVEPVKDAKNTEDVVEKFNQLLAELRANGLIKKSD